MRARLLLCAALVVSSAIGSHDADACGMVLHARTVSSPFEYPYLSEERVLIVWDKNTQTEQGRKKDPTLKGTVAVRFLIDTTGAVESANLSGGTMPDAQVSRCVVGVFRTLSFPEPEGGKVVVTYPLEFKYE